MDKNKAFFVPGMLGIVPFLVIVILFPFNNGTIKGSSSNYGILPTKAENLDRVARIVNHSGYNIELHWVHSGTGETVLMSSPYIADEEVMTFNSYVGHKFQVNEVPDATSNTCGGEDNTCRMNWMTLNKNHDQVFTIEGDFTIDHVDDKSIVRQLEAENNLDRCHEEQLKYIQMNSESITPDMATKVIDDMVSCIGPGVADRFEELDEELAFQASVRVKMGNSLENLTCADETAPLSEPIENRTWTDKGKDFNVSVMLDRRNSKIHVVDKFIEPNECAAMENAAKNHLHAATVADSNGGSQLSENRKAMQAGIKVPWHKESQGDPIAVLSRRVFDYTNWVTGLNLKEHGQEELMSIQYFGRGEQEEKPDRYMPHCDGSCEGQLHKEGGRVATMVMYCEVADVGGATNFANSFVKVRPKRGSAVFFSYVGDNMIMDNGFTTHSGCPVIHGEKKIVTQWMRLGVDKDNPWDSWNTLGIKITDTLND